MQGGALPGAHLAGLLLPVRVVDALPHQVGADLFQPFRLDPRQAARIEPRRLHQLGGDDPAAGFLRQRRTGMRPETDAARAEIVALLLALQAEVAEEARQQGLVHLLVGRRLFVLAPAVFPGERVQLGVHLAPLAHAEITQEVPAAPVALLALRLVRPDLIEGLPQIQPGEEFRALLLLVAAPFGVGLVGRAGLLGRPLARVLHRQRGGDDEHLAQAMAVARGEDHAGDARVERQLGQLAAGLRQILVGTAPLL
ncbi:MAG: hypothetical protein EFKGCFLK_02172 [Rhodocyclaceae bacterium]|nr:hypothetical protein [Rhodocyclaceae bacterium]